eukprot:CAMPEP_0204616886 /NCGR_PEP_ID=MMETSP0717-20131115/4020_1 /ASSEMBLY_ACC=CAM_ASM_000666 /TAXON_ID=230516 /ORGANISM="Chaetoceros curvisetus" /LENGTH=495 /DNA_ID=CAMNT_0051630261 /DNA_START=76 /DNA_END=1563 /DNA_ORIENTATION=+
MSNTEASSVSSRTSTSTGVSSNRRSIFGSTVKKQYDGSQPYNPESSKLTTRRSFVRHGSIDVSSVASASNASTISSSAYTNVADHNGRHSSPPKVIRPIVTQGGITRTASPRKNRVRSISSCSPIDSQTSTFQNPPPTTLMMCQPVSKGMEPKKSNCEEKKDDDHSNSNAHDNGKKKPQSISLEKQLFHRLHNSNVKSPSIKEFNECWAFSKTVKSHFKNTKFDLIVDVAGGHGGLAALFLILTSASRAVVIDPAKVGQNGVELAWGDYYKGGNKDGGRSKGNDNEKVLDYRYECLRTGLRDELSNAIFGDEKKKIHPSRILVVACHACQHLTDETLEIACSFGVHAAVMPCCQKDLTGGSWKAAGKSLGIGIGPLLDVLVAGKVMSWASGEKSGVSYQVRMKLIDRKITPQNRIILCKAEGLHESSSMASERIKAHEKLERAYKKAHSHPQSHSQSSRHKKTFAILKRESLCIKSAALGLAAGLLLSNLSRRRK